VHEPAYQIGQKSLLSEQTHTLHQLLYQTTT